MAEKKRVHAPQLARSISPCWIIRICILKERFILLEKEQLLTYSEALASEQKAFT